MKALLMSCLNLLLTLTCFGQVIIDGVTLDTLTTPYCQLSCDNPNSFGRARIRIDYGQRFVDTGFNRQKIGDARNADIRFNSGIDALNFMARNGWELVKFTTQKETFIYLLRRREQ